MQAMERKHTIPVSREDLVFSVDMALRKAERFWPKKRGPGDHDRLRPIAEMIADHLDLCGIKFFKRPRGPRPQHARSLGHAAAGREAGRRGRLTPGRAQSSSGNIMVIAGPPSSPAPIATMGQCLRGGRLLSRRSLRMSRTSTLMVTRSLLEARTA